MKKRFSVTGMTCSACSAHVQRAVSAVNGVTAVEVNLLTASMTVAFDETVTDDAAIIAAVVAAGYGAGGDTPAVKEKSATAAAQRADGSMKRRLWLSLGFLLLLMTVSMGHMIGLPLPAFLSGHAGAVNFALTQLLLCLPIVYLNRAYFKKGLPALFRGNPNMDSLVAVGSLAALIYGVFALYRMAYGAGIGDHALVARYHEDLYFESSGMILTLITLGKYLESRSKSKTTEALEALMDLTPDTAVVERDGNEVTVTVEQIAVGDIVLVRPGGRIPVDGVMLEGHTTVDESAITGESLPVLKETGDTLVSGTMNKTGFVRMRATRVGQDTTLSQIIQLVEQAGAGKAPIAKTADAVARIFVPTVMVIALITGIVWLSVGAPFETALSYAICVLVISCPCALGLATPVAIMVGTGKGAQNGILFKSGEALETAHKINCVVLDKTGTVTTGKPTVTDTVALTATEHDLWQLAVDLESKSEHPLSMAVLEEGARRGVTAVPVSQFETVPGKGIVAVRNGVTCLAGNERLMREQGVDVSAYADTLNAFADQGKTPLLFAQNGTLCGIVAVADVIREESEEAIRELRAMGVDVYMLTGDRERTAKAIASKLPLSGVTADVLPQDKEREVARLRGEGKTVAMVGDGINDAPALVSADVGMAIGAGTDVAVESASVVLMKSDLRDVPTAIKLSRAVMRNIRQNLFWAFFYNCLGIPLAAGVFEPLFGWRLTPMFAAAAMSCSSIFVVSNALRLKWFHRVGTRHDTTKEENTMIVLTIDGMMCPRCQKHVQDALLAVAGVGEVTVDLQNGKATVVGGTATAQQLADAVVAAGYDVTEIK